MGRIQKIIVWTLTAMWLATAGMPGSAQAISIGKEKELADEFMKVVRKRYELIEDPFLVSYINDLGNRLVSQFPPQPFAYQFYVINGNVYNAFAGPGGHVFINSGLIAAMETEDELAGILMHEISHVVCRHISQRIERSTKIGMASLAGMVAGIFLGGGGDLGKAVSVGSLAAGQSAQLKYSRKDEMEADQLGLKYLSQLGYSAEGLLAVLKKIRAKTWFGSDQMPSYLSTHPAVEDRIAYIDGWLSTHPKDRGKALVHSERFERVRVRLAALYGDAELSVQRFQALSRKYPNRPLAHYGFGLALARTSRDVDAVDEFQTALSLDPSAHYVLSDLGRSYYSIGQYNDAVDVLQRAVAADPDDTDARFYLGRIDLSLGNYAGAVDHLERVMDRAPHYPQAASFLGEAYGKMGRLGPAHFYLGLYYKDQNSLRNAVFHMKRALEHLTDPVRSEKARAVLKEMEDEERKGPEGGAGPGRKP